MVTSAEHRANFFPDYTTRTAGKMPEFGKSNNIEPTEKIGLSAGDDVVGVEDDSAFMTILKTAIDVVNPLQHIPVVSSIYQKISGDEINTPAKIAGDAVYGGVMGGLVSMATSALEFMIENPTEGTVKTAKTDETGTINKAIVDLERTNSAIKSYLDAELTSQQKSTFLFSIEN